jgi:hypothetical protein
MGDFGNDLDTTSVGDCGSFGQFVKMIARQLWEFRNSICPAADINLLNAPKKSQNAPMVGSST